MTADPRVARLRNLDTEATSGPWRRGAHFAITSDDANICGTTRVAVMHDGGRQRQARGSMDADAALIAAMRNAWPAMVTLVEGVLGRHKPGALTLRYCAACSNAHPCPDRTDALAVLDTLDPP
jgi:hypothetical protein